MLDDRFVEEEVEEVHVEDAGFVEGAVQDVVADDDLAARLSALGHWMLDRVYPFKAMEEPFVLCGNPRFCTQYNNSVTRENVGPMLSGTASWLSLSVSAFRFCRRNKA